VVALRGAAVGLPAGMSAAAARVAAASPTRTRPRIGSFFAGDGGKACCT
jgi:hypothetical protein